MTDARVHGWRSEWKVRKWRCVWMRAWKGSWIWGNFFRWKKTWIYFWWRGSSSWREWDYKNIDREQDLGRGRWNCIEAHAGKEVSLSQEVWKLFLWDRQKGGKLGPWWVSLEKEEKEVEGFLSDGSFSLWQWPQLLRWRGIGWRKGCGKCVELPTWRMRKGI